MVPIVTIEDHTVTVMSGLRLVEQKRNCLDPLLSTTKSGSCMESKPTRASAADQGVRPTALTSFGKTK